MTSSSRSSKPSPIHTLPREILSQIFRLVLAGEPCLPQYGLRAGPQIHYSSYPEFLSHVCSNWRKISTGLHELWVHIDLSLYQLLSDKLSPRAEAYISRSGQSSLYVHVHGLQCIHSGLPNNTPTTTLISMAARIHTLDLSISQVHINLCERVLGAFVDSCQPGVFTRLVVRNASFKPALPTFIMAKDEEVRNPIYRRFPLAVSEEQLDDVFLSCTSLQLRGLFFPWTSRAYQGLIELHLTCPSTRVEISELQLVAILKSSPQLRNLDIRISIQSNVTSDAPQLEPVALPELEKLTAAIDHEANLARLVRLIAPGSKPLDVSFHLKNNIDIFVDPPFADYVKEFFLRSSVERLSVSRVEYSVMINLLRLAPNIRTLALKHCSWTWGSKYEVQLPTQCGHLEALYVIDSSISMDDLLDFIEAFEVRKLVCWRYRQFRGGAEFTRDSLDEALHEGELSPCPVVELSNDSPIDSDVD